MHKIEFKVRACPSSNTRLVAKSWLHTHSKCTQGRRSWAWAQGFHNTLGVQPWFAALMTPCPHQTAQHSRKEHGKVACLSSSSIPQPSVPQEESWGDFAASVARRFTNLFPVWIILAAGIALAWPQFFSWFDNRWLTWGLAATMLGMGLTMKVEDFTNVFQSMPALLGLGLVLQYTVMPALGFAFSRFAGLEPSYACGVALLSACPGGTASNIVAYIAGGEMGLSILMTTASTLGAIVATPAITQLLAGSIVPVNGLALFMSTLQVVLAPVLLGAFINQRFPQTVAKCSRFTPALSTLLVAFIIGSTLAASAKAVLSSGPKLLGAVAALHTAGFAVGYLVSRALGLSEKICRTNSIEVGMQNSTLGAMLARVHFTDPLVAVPCALSSCCHATIGSLLAAYWRSKPVRE